MRGLAMEADRQEQLQTLETVRRGMLPGEGGKAPMILTEEHIEDRAPDASPMVKRQLARELAALTDERERLRQATPEYQAETAGQVAAGIAAYQPLADERYDEFVRIDGMIRTLPRGSAVREEMTRRLEERRAGTALAGTPADSALRSMEIAREHGAFGRVARREPVPTERLIRSGFLGDAGKLKSLGLTGEQARGVVDPPRYEGAGRIPVNELRKQAFLKLAPVWQQRGEVTADSYVQATAEAILNGTEAVDHVSEEQRKKDLTDELTIQSEYGAAVTEFLDWHRGRPDADEIAIREKVIELSERPRLRSLSTQIRSGAKGGSDIQPSTP